MKQLHDAEIDSPRAWITVVTAFMSCFTLFGVTYSFGAFFRPMGREFGAGRMPTAAVSSITAGIYNALGAPAGHLSDRYGPRPVLFAAAVFMSTGLVLTSRIDRLWIGYLTYGLGVSSIAIYVPFVYLPEFAQHRGVSRIAAATLVGIIGGASVVGRMGLGAVADRTGIMWLYKLCTLALGLSYAVWILTSGYGWLLVFALTMGTAYGGLVALAPAVVAELFGVKGPGAMLGTLYTSSAISALVGPPLAGLVIDRSGSYL